MRPKGVAGEGPYAAPGMEGGKVGDVRRLVRSLPFSAYIKDLKKATLEKNYRGTKITLVKGAHDLGIAKSDRLSMSCYVTSLLSPHRPAYLLDCYTSPWEVMPPRGCCTRERCYSVHHRQSDSHH